MFILALIFIFGSYYSEIKYLKETYSVINKIYKNKILFEGDLDEKNKFEKTIAKPRLGKIQTIPFILIMIILIIRLILTFPWK